MIPCQNVSYNEADSISGSARQRLLQRCDGGVCRCHNDRDIILSVSQQRRGISTGLASCVHCRNVSLTAETWHLGRLALQPLATTCRSHKKTVRGNVFFTLTAPPALDTGV